MNYAANDKPQHILLLKNASVEVVQAYVMKLCFILIEFKCGVQFSPEQKGGVQDA